MVAAIVLASIWLAIVLSVPFVNGIRMKFFGGKESIVKMQRIAKPRQDLSTDYWVKWDVYGPVGYWNVRKHLNGMTCGYTEAEAFEDAKGRIDGALREVTPSMKDKPVVWPVISYRIDEQGNMIDPKEGR